MQASELIVPSEGATCWENVTCTAQTTDHDGTRVYVPYMKVWCGVLLCLLVCVAVCVIMCVIMCVTVWIAMYV